MVDKSKFVNHFEVDEGLQCLLERDFYTPAHVSPASSESLLMIENLLSPALADVLAREVSAHQWLAVGLDGFANKPVEQVGNYRLSNWNPGFAAALWRRIQPLLPSQRAMDAWTPTDHDNHALWEPCGVSPLFRYIRYVEGGQLVAHYDATHVEDEDHRSLMSLVIYLTSNERGATRFLRDPQAGRRMDDMDFSDWDRAGRDDEVLHRVTPWWGSAIAFDHRLLHDGEPLEPGDPEKIIIRTDIMFRRVHV